MRGLPRGVGGVSGVRGTSGVAASGGAFAEPAGAVANAARRCAGHDSTAWISDTTQDEFLPVAGECAERTCAGDAAAGCGFSVGQLYPSIPSRACAQADAGP